MTSIDELSLKISNYKCFGSEAIGYERILPVNLIIGRNNTGKSTLLDLVDYITSPRDFSRLGHKGQAPQVIISGTLHEEELRAVFSPNISGGEISGNHWEYGKRLMGHAIAWAVTKDGYHVVALTPSIEDKLNTYANNLAIKKGNPFSGLSFKRLLADRDITPEPGNDGLVIQSNGGGVTNAIRAYLNRSDLPSSMVERLLLSELNSIFEPDGSIARIIVQQVGDINSNWELYFEETEKGLVPLSHTGSGLKTILLVLAFVHLVPHIENKSLSKYLFGFEELENNLHPALLRRLLLYLRGIAEREGCRFFLTTHSNVAIDLFSSDEKAQILHVTHDGKCATAKRVTTYVENRGILDDLDIRASDLLQANGIVWLEGPSDRLYFNRWVELWTGGRLKEGAHYQCVFYGGRLLAHLSANDPDVDTADVVKILRVNRNAVLIIDSDRKRKGQPINATKQRVIAEVEGFGGMAWLTAGKEIENYIPASALAALYGTQNSTALEQYQDLAEYLNNIKADEGRKFLRNKVLFAERVCPYVTRVDVENTFDLHEKVKAACKHILKWNGLDESILRV